MSGFTLAYLARLEGWGLLVIALQGVLLLLSWQAWRRAVAAPATRHRLACLHLAALMVLPALALAVMQAAMLAAAEAPPHGPPVAARPSPSDGVRIALALAAAAVWALGVLAMLLRLARSPACVTRLRPPARACARRCVAPCVAAWSTWRPSYARPRSGVRR